MRAVCYEDGIQRISELLDWGLIEDAFAASSLLAHIFSVPKEETLDDLLLYRSPVKV